MHSYLYRNVCLYGSESGYLLARGELVFSGSRSRSHELLKLLCMVYSMNSDDSYADCMNQNVRISSSILYIETVSHRYAIACAPSNDVCA